MLFVSPVVLYVIRSPFCISRSIRFSPVECNHFFLFQLKSVRRIFGKVASCCSHSCIPLSSLPHHSSHNSTSRGYFGRTVLEAIVIFRKMRKKPSGVLFIKVRQWFYFYWLSFMLLSFVSSFAMWRTITTDDLPSFSRKSVLVEWSSR